MQFFLSPFSLARILHDTPLDDYEARRLVGEGASVNYVLEETETLICFCVKCKTVAKPVCGSVLIAAMPPPSRLLDLNATGHCHSHTISQIIANSFIIADETVFHQVTVRRNLKHVNNMNILQRNSKFSFDAVFVSLVSRPKIDELHSPQEFAIALSKDKRKENKSLVYNHRQGS